MSDAVTGFVLLVVFAGIVFVGAVMGAGVYLIIVIAERRNRRRTLTDEQVADALAPLGGVDRLDPGAFGVDISCWPSRAPRNGSAHEDTVA